MRGTRMREYLLSADAASEVTDVLPNAKQVHIKVDGKELTVNPPPNSGPLVYMVAMQAEDVAVEDQTHSVLELFRALMSEEDARFIRGSLASGRVNLELLSRIVRDLLEEWSARPTKSPRGSSSRRVIIGSVSTDGAPSEG